MTLAEFKAWFEGFTEGMDAAPNEEQWKRIKDRVSEINGTAISYPIFVDRYVQPCRPYFPSSPYWSSSTYSSNSFNSQSAMKELGKAQWKSINHTAS